LGSYAQGVYRLADVVTDGSMNHPMPVDERLPFKGRADDEHPKMGLGTRRDAVHRALIHDSELRRLEVFPELSFDAFLYGHP
jgi:hypothetical protein